MDMMSALQQAGGIDAVSRELGIDSSTAQTGVGALLPAILAGVGAQAENHPQGLGGLGSILGSLRILLRLQFSLPRTLSPS